MPVGQHDPTKKMIQQPELFVMAAKLRKIADELQDAADGDLRIGESVLFNDDPDSGSGMPIGKRYTILADVFTSKLKK